MLSNHSNSMLISSKILFLLFCLCIINFNFGYQFNIVIFLQSLTAGIKSNSLKPNNESQATRSNNIKASIKYYVADVTLMVKGPNQLSEHQEHG